MLKTCLRGTRGVVTYDDSLILWIKAQDSVDAYLIAMLSLNDLLKVRINKRDLVLFVFC